MKRKLVIFDLDDALYQTLHKLEKVIAKNKYNKPLILGINGVDTSGKTSFSKELSKYLTNKGYKIELIHIDDFHNHSSIRSKGDNPIDSYIDNAFNLELFEREILNPIKENNKLKKELKLLNLDTDEFTNIKHYNIDVDTIVIVEGVLLYRDPIDKYFDLRLFLDISFEEVLKRAEVRDVPKYGIEFLERYRNKYIPIQQKYITNYLPREKSEIIIDNHNYLRPMIIKGENL